MKATEQFFCVVLFVLQHLLRRNLGFFSESILTAFAHGGEVGSSVLKRRQDPQLPRLTDASKVSESTETLLFVKSKNNNQNYRKFE